METISTKFGPGGVEEARLDGQWRVLVEARGTPGVLVVAPPMRVLYVTEAAWRLMGHLQEGEEASGRAAGGRAKGVVPSQILDLCRELFQSLKSGGHGKDLEQPHVTRFVRASTGGILVRGFLIADGEHGTARVVVILEQIDPEKEVLTGPIETDVALTDREKSVVRCLAKGWTNKEIAAALHLALPTVKEHIRHIMEKTGTTTRTGVLAKLFGI